MIAVIDYCIYTTSRLSQSYLIYIIKSNSDYHSQLIMKQKDYRFSSLWICGIPDFLYFSVLT